MPKQSILFAPLLPLLTALVIGLWMLVRQGDTRSKEKIVAGISKLSAWTVLLLLLAHDIWAAAQGASGLVNIAEWFSVGLYKIKLNFYLDSFSLGFATIIALLCALTLHFAGAYMHRETGFERFFMVLNLFMGAMLLIVLAGNAVFTFVGWELAGFSSYLLISYAQERKVATTNATRVFITNRIGDAGFVLGLFLLFSWAHSSEWSTLANKTQNVNVLLMSLTAIAFLIAAAAKSAQVPFSPWVSRALEGPTPSSAIFYGALILHAGVFLLIRLEPVLRQVPAIMAIIAILGLLTALYGLLCGYVHSDIKASLMFSTVAQVGLMFLWCGLGWFVLAQWHLCLHALWRSYQFLIAPSILHLVNRGNRPVPQWLRGNRFLYQAAMQRFWLEPLGDAVITNPFNKLAAETHAFDEQVVTPLVGLPNQAKAVSSLAQWEDLKSGAQASSESSVGRGSGLLGTLLEKIAAALHWFEERLVLRGGGENLMQGLRRLGNSLSKVDSLLSEPRYLVIMLVITLIVVL